MLKLLAARAGPSGLDASVVFWDDIVLLCIIGVLFFFTLPRALARLSRGGGWAEGYFLRAGAARMSDDQSVSSRRHLARELTTSLSEKHNATKVPRHVRAWQAILPVRLMHVIRFPLVGRVSVGRTIVCALYFALLLFAALYRTTIWTNPVRAGYVAVAQVPFVYVLATKNNVLSVLLGTAYDRLNYLHRFAGRLLVLAANVHAIGYIYQFTMAGEWIKVISRPSIAWGLVSLILFDIMFLFSLDIFRRRLHNLFLTTHIVASIVVLATICLHMDAAIPYVAVAAALYGLDRVLRLLKSRICTATLTYLPELHTTQLRIPALTRGWRAGQHVRVRVLSSGMGLYGWAEVHPYTIASAGGGTLQDSMVLLCKTTGRWTRRLHAIAAADRKGAGMGSNVRVWVEGPYGGPGYTIPNSFNGAMFVVGGSGVSYGLAAAEELLQQAQAGTSSVRAIELVWAVHHPECLRPLLPLLSALVSLSDTVDIDFRISVFYTRAVTQEHTTKDLAMPPGITLRSGRPRVRVMLSALLERTLSSVQDVENGRGVYVGVCGPVSLGDAVRKAVGDPAVGQLSRPLGGVELHEEIFSL